MWHSILVALPGVRLVPPTEAQLLGSPVGDNACVSSILSEKVDALRRLDERLKLLSAHDSLILLRNCFALPKLLYLLRTAPCICSDVLLSYDDCLLELLSSVTNTILDRHGSAWVQATLRVKIGGLGIRSAVSVAPSAFMASSLSIAELVEDILPLCTNALPAPHLEGAQLLWSSGQSHQAPGK